MIDAKEAESFVVQNIIQLEDELISLEQLNGRILSRDIRSSRLQPPFDRVAMDGIAIHSDSLSLRKFNIENIQKAGMDALTLDQKDGAIEVMTGAMLPRGTDTVIPYEQIKIVNDHVELLEKCQPLAKQNIHFKGSDYLTDETLLKAGKKLHTASIALIAGQGAKEVWVKKLPKIALISTGDELIEPGEECRPWQIWKSNPYGISSELKSLGASLDLSFFHLDDKEEEVFSKLEDILKTHDYLILSGGVSMGKFDFVHTVMNDLKVKKIFHKIKQKPGKPLLFGQGEQGQVVFGLPGNPVSALVCLKKYVIPNILTSLGHVQEKQYCVLNEEVIFKKEFTLFKPVSLSFTHEGKILGTPIDSNGSGDFASLGLSDGFIQLPPDQTLYKKGDVYPFYRWNQN
jgi:molybdopterin molybdotransferase